MPETHLTDQTNQRWEQLLRYRYIELISLWEGRLTTRKLCETFGIGRQQANKDLSNYRRALKRGDLVYDAVSKYYSPSGLRSNFDAGASLRIFAIGSPAE